MPRLVQIETWFFGIIHCILHVIIELDNKSFNIVDPPSLVTTVPSKIARSKTGSSVTFQCLGNKLQVYLIQVGQNLSEKRNIWLITEQGSKGQ